MLDNRVELVLGTSVPDADANDAKKPGASHRPLTNEAPNWLMRLLLFRANGSVVPSLFNVKATAAGLLHAAFTKETFLSARVTMRLKVGHLMKKSNFHVGYANENPAIWPMSLVGAGAPPTVDGLKLPGGDCSGVT